MASWAHMEFSSRCSLMKFYYSDKYSDVTVKVGDMSLPAHRIILAQHSVYFKRAFLGRFPVASGTVIDLGEDDHFDMVRAMIRFMYTGHVPYTVLPGESVVEAMADLFVLADKYDVEGLRVSVCNHFTCAIDSAFSEGNNIIQHRFVTSIVPKICGPRALQLADKRLRQSIMKLCKVHWSTLLLDADFCALFVTGQLFDTDNGSGFLQHLSLEVDEDGKHVSNTKICLDTWRPIPEPRIEQCFQAFSDINISFGDGQMVATHRILLSTHSPYFDDMLKQYSVNDCVDLGREDDPILIETMLQEIFDPEHVAKAPDLAAFSAAMCLLTKKYDLRDASYRHRHRFVETMNKEKEEPSYPQALALVCGPDSSKFANTMLPEQAFESCLTDAKTLVKKNKTFLKMLKEGTLFSAEYAGWFAAGLATLIKED